MFTMYSTASTPVSATSGSMPLLTSRFSMSTTTGSPTSSTGEISPLIIDYSHKKHARQTLPAVPLKYFHAAPSPLQAEAMVPGSLAATPFSSPSEYSFSDDSTSALSFGSSSSSEAPSSSPPTPGAHSDPQPAASSSTTAFINRPNIAASMPADTDAANATTETLLRRVPVKRKNSRPPQKFSLEILELMETIAGDLKAIQSPKEKPGRRQALQALGVTWVDEDEQEECSNGGLSLIDEDEEGWARGPMRVSPEKAIGGMRRRRDTLVEMNEARLAALRRLLEEGDDGMYIE